MSDSPEQKFLRERKSQLKRLMRIQRDTLAEVTRLLRQAQAQIKGELAGSPSDFQAWRLTGLQQQVRQALAEIDASGGRALSQGARQSWSAGLDLVDQPLASAGIEIAAILPIVDLRQLTAMQSFLTDRMTNITVTAANAINAQLGSVAIGVQTPGQAADAITRIVEGGRQRAITVIRTELGRAYSTASQGRLEQAATYLPELQKQWRRSGKIHSRPAHDIIDGQIRAVAEPYDVDGYKLMYPRDPGAPAKETINCGCASLPYMASWDMSTPGRKPFSDEELAGSPTKRALQGLE